MIVGTALLALMAMAWLSEPATKLQPIRIKADPQRRR